MSDWRQRTQLLIGETGIRQLEQAHVLVVGLGGVGSYAAEALVRAGVGKLTIVDGDEVDATNKNRQLQALDSSIGKNKAALLKERFSDINPQAEIIALSTFLEPDAFQALLQNDRFDYALDCIDSIQPKLNFIVLVRAMKIPFIASMGAGGKMDPQKIRIADISKTRECKFAQQIKKMLKQKGIHDRVMTVYSEEIQPKESLAMTDGSRYKSSYYGTISYMPAMFGMTMASYVIRRLLGDDKKQD
ncbi:MAG TPA: tRNA threonylcarbamoyladenosine dehydratase [Saprospiraceae bacterium]|nr:tRNA threonylcarbamoyladenosine dehydratase [Saprospiraceae bacterium]